MNEIVNPTTNGVTVELDLGALGQQVAREVAQHLAYLFPTDAAEFWGMLAEQAHRERQRVADMLDLVCSHGSSCPYKSEVLGKARPGSEDTSKGEGNAAP